MENGEGPMRDVERRRKERLRPREITFVAVRPEFNRLGRLINISRSGLCFQYMEKEAGKDDSAFIEIDLFVSQNGFYLPGVPCRVIYNRVIEESVRSFRSLAYRRCGLHFDELHRDKADQLEIYLNFHTTAGT